MWPTGCRAPEIFLGQEDYTEAVDMWAVGCIFGELLRNEPLFPGRTEVDMLERMVRLLGSPSEAIWPVWVCLSIPSQLAPLPFHAKRIWNSSCFEAQGAPAGITPPAGDGSSNG
jgi:serine/threonine protein kinase